LDNLDWLEDPFLMMARSFEFSTPKDIDAELADKWQTFHFSTRLKLEGAEHFCRQLFGAASMPDDLGLPLLAHRQLKWYLDAFFFELMAAWNTLLQELNILYYHTSPLAMGKVEWSSIKANVPEELRRYIDKEYCKEWFKKIRRYRNTATHYAYVPTGSWKAGLGDKPLDYDEYDVSIYYTPTDRAKFKEEKIKVCYTYLHNMVKFISQVWNNMAQMPSIS